MARYIDADALIAEADGYKRWRHLIRQPRLTPSPQGEGFGGYERGE